MGYPDMGNGRYAALLPYEGAWVASGTHCCWQRTHPAQRCGDRWPGSPRPRMAPCRLAGVQPRPARALPVSGGSRTDAHLRAALWPVVASLRGWRPHRLRGGPRVLRPRLDERRSGQALGWPRAAGHPLPRHPDLRGDLRWRAADGHPQGHDPGLNTPQSTPPTAHTAGAGAWQGRGGGCAVKGHILKWLGDWRERGGG